MKNSNLINEPCSCCEKDENDNWIHEPCCNIWGECCSDANDEKDTIGNCIHCGAQMFKEDGFWYHHSQEEIPIEERGTIHYGI